MRPSALCIGHACQDLCMIVDGYPGENTKTETDLLLESGGGPAANAAFLLARWGISTAFAGVVGMDDYGNRVIKDLQDAGVNCQCTDRRKEAITPVSFIICNRSTGTRTIINRKHPNTGLSLSAEQLSGWQPQLLLFDGHEPAASLQALNQYPSAITLLDAGSLREGTQTLASKVDYLVCSEKFAQQATGESNVDAHWLDCLQKLRDLNSKTIVVTLGERGLIYQDGQQTGRMAAWPVKAVDTTAAGDIFHGAFAFSLLHGMSLCQCLNIATKAAGLSVQKLGGRSSIPDRDEVLGE